MSARWRLALGTTNSSADSQAITWALMGVLQCQRLRVQHFLSQSSFTPWDGAGAVTGASSRHLDPWLMPRPLCRELFAHGSADCDVAVIEGRFCSADAPVPRRQSPLDILSDWLDLARIAVVDVADWTDCRLPTIPPRADAILLDNLSSADDFCRLQLTIEACCGIPVIGGLEALPEVRSRLARMPWGSRPPRELCLELSKSLARHIRMDRLRRVARRCRAMPARPKVFAPPGERRPLRIAVAYDEAFHCYFPDTLDALEWLGAELIDFSPLADEKLPDRADIVYLGCGHPERYAKSLSQNHCMTWALRRHICRGGRVYAECGGLAYLCQAIEAGNGTTVPMVGAIPACARQAARPCAPEPVEVTLARHTWLGKPGTRLRGYRNPNWLILPAGDLKGCIKESDRRFDMVSNQRVIGSRLHLNFVAHAACLHGFFQPSTASAVSQSGTH